MLIETKMSPTYMRNEIEEEIAVLKFYAYILVPAIILYYIGTLDIAPTIRNQKPVVEIRGTMMSSYGFDFDKNGSIDSAITYVTTGRASASFPVPRTHKVFYELQSKYLSEKSASK